MTREEKVNLLNTLLEIEEKNDIGNLTRTDRREFQQWVEDLIDNYCEEREHGKCPFTQVDPQEGATNDKKRSNLSNIRSQGAYIA